MNTFYFIIITIIVSTSHFYAQSKYGDCVDSYNICELGDFHFPALTGSGQVHDDLKITDHSVQEKNSVWMDFEVDNSGTLELLISPDNIQDDLDFILYESLTCMDNKAIRIMTSGRTLGEKSPSCLGNMGLKEGFLDINEEKGCYDFSDNFLAPIKLPKGKKYKLLINSYKQSKGGFTVLLESQDQLKLVNKCQMLPDKFDFNTYPNPTKDRLFIEPNIEYRETVSIEVFSLQGKRVTSKFNQSFNRTIEMNISDLSEGQYLIRITKGDKIRLATFVKL